MGSESAPDLPQNLKDLEIDDTCHEGHCPSEAPPPVVTVNVGGVLFSTHSATLQKVGTLQLHYISNPKENFCASFTGLKTC